MSITKPGRYLLDAEGKLHPMRRRYHVQPVAMVKVQPRPCTSPRPPKIDLSTAPSSMESIAASWKGQR